MKRIEFKENQRFRQWDVLLFLGILIIGLSTKFLYSTIIAANTDIQVGTFSIVVFVLVGLIIYLLNIRLITKITQKGIQYQYFPVHYRRKKIRWEEVESCQIVETPLQAELSGWGVSFFKEHVFSVSGKTGLSLTLKDGRRIFIGTSDIEELKSTLQAIRYQ